MKNKKIILEFLPEEELYVAKNVPLEREFFLGLKEKGFLTHVSYFEDLHDVLISDVHVVDEDLTGKDKVSVYIYTDQPVPENWKNDVGRYLNKDLINKLDESENLECMFDIPIENVSIIGKGKPILIEIPIE